MAQCGVPRLVRADIGLIAGCPDGFHLVQGAASGAGQEIQLIDSQFGQVLRGIQRVFIRNLPDELGFAQGNAIGIRQLLQGAIGGDGLAEHRAGEGVGLQQGIDFLGQPGLQGRALGGVAVVHADENGVGQLAEIAIAQHGAHQGVDGHVQAAAGKIHVA